MREEVVVSRIDTHAGLLELEAEWDRLLTLSDVASPFLTFGWQTAWLGSYGKRHRPFVLVARIGDALVGLWPLARVARGPFRVLEPIGARRSDWLDVLTTAGQREAVLSAFFRYLASTKPEWDLIECRDVLAESPTFGVIGDCVGELGCRWQVRTAAPYLALKGTWDDFLRSKRSKFRTNLQYYRRLAEREGGGFRITRHVWTEADQVVAEMADVERRSWKAARGNLKISTAVGQAFYSRFCSYFAARGELDIWRADCNGRLIAFLVNFNHAGKCYHYNTCFDEAHGKISPGLLLHAEAIKDAFENGRSEYDFLSGDEPYKARWSSGKRDICHLAIHNDRIRSRLSFLLLVASRWAFRKSSMLRRIREQLLASVRKMSRARV